MSPRVNRQAKPQSSIARSLVSQPHFILPGPARAENENQEALGEVWERQGKHTKQNLEKMHYFIRKNTFDIFQLEEGWDAALKEWHVVAHLDGAILGRFFLLLHAMVPPLDLSRGNDISYQKTVSRLAMVLFTP